MKKIVLMLIIFIIVFMFLIFNNHGKENNFKFDFIYVGSYEKDLNISDNYIFTNYDDLLEVLDIDDYIGTFNKKILVKKDFEKNNYVLVPISYAYCGVTDLKPDNYKINGNDIKINVKYKKTCGVCEFDNLYYLLKINKKMTKVNLDFEYIPVNDIKCDPNLEMNG